MAGYRGGGVMGLSLGLGVGGADRCGDRGVQVQQMAVPVIAHRMVMDPQARFSGVTARGVVEDLMKKLKVPA